MPRHAEVYCLYWLFLFVLHPFSEVLLTVRSFSNSCMYMCVCVCVCFFLKHKNGTILAFFSPHLSACYGGQSMSVHIALPFSIRLVCNIPPWTSIIFRMTNVYFHCNITNRSFRDLTVFHYTQFSSIAQSCPTLCDPMNTTLPQKRMFLVLLCEYSILLLLLLLLLSHFGRVRLCATP